MLTTEDTESTEELDRIDKIDKINQNHLVHPVNPVEKILYALRVLRGSTWSSNLGKPQSVLLSNAQLHLSESMPLITQPQLVR